MSNEITTRENDFALEMKQVEDMQKMCEMLSKTSHYHRMGKDGIFAIITTARDLGISPLRALNGALYFVQGKVGMSTELMASLIRRQGHSICKDPQSSKSSCTLHGKRADNGDIWTVTFSIDDAKKAGIYKDAGPWGKYPETMCYNRAMSILARQLFPDVIKGAAYEKDELIEIAESRDESECKAALPNEIDITPKVESEEEKLKKHNELVQSLNEIQSLYDQCSNETKVKFDAFIKKEYSIEFREQLPLIHHDYIKNVLRQKLKQEQDLKDKETPKFNNPWGLDNSLFIGAPQ